jgi:hypothetical protein
MALDTFEERALWIEHQRQQMDRDREASEASKRHYEEFDTRMQVFHFAMQFASIQMTSLAMGVLCNPDPKAAALCAASIPGIYDLPAAVLSDIRRDFASGAKP